MTYRVITPVHHDGTIYKPGEDIDVTGQEADALLQAKAIEPMHKPFARKGQISIPVNFESEAENG
jgi:hypothetical protein